MEANDIRKASDMLISLVYPRRCPVCDDALKKDDGLIHPDCRKKLRSAGRIVCMKCGKPLADATAEYCDDCMRIRHSYDRGYSVFRYRSVSGSVYRFKYGGRREYADFYAEEVEKRLGETIKGLGADALIPVPMYGHKKRVRGYNQAEVLARAIGQKTAIPVYADVMKRVRNTPPMKLLDERSRRMNLKKAFIISRNDVKFKCIILVDDIYTTGSTVDEMARIFRRNGVGRIYVITLAIGQIG